jgi:hypothetical protein
MFVPSLRKPLATATTLALSLALSSTLAAQTAATPEPAAPAAAEAKPSEPEIKPADKPWYEKVKLSGYVFGDAYAAVDHHDSAIQDQNGFWIRRAYLTFDYAIVDQWSARLRFEANSPGDFKTNAKLDPFIKDAYLAWKGTDTDVLVGISPSPTWELVEGFWGYRAVEKTPVDLYRIGSSRDFGLAAKGKLAGGKVVYHAMFGNGAGEGAETNEGKKVMLAVGFKPTDAFVFELYADTEDRPGATDRTTWQGFLGWKGKRSRYGLQYVTQDRQVATGPDQTLAVGSIFGVWELTDKTSLLARYDRSFDVNPEGDRIPYLAIAKDSEFDFALLGLDYQLAKKINLMPNLEYVMYRETDGRPAPDDDLMARLTLYFQF